VIRFVHQTDDLWVLDKPANLSLLADRSGADNLWSLIKQQPGKPYLVHRLDKGTSGVLLIARNAQTQRHLTRAFAQHQVRKFYLAWVSGSFPSGRTYHIDLPLCRGRKSRFRVAGERHNITLQDNRYSVVQDRPGIDAYTRVRCLRTAGPYSLLAVQPRHGRSHQIRVHLSWLGYPIKGDHLYGRPADSAQQAARLMLHCHRLVVPQQADAEGASQAFCAAMPDSFAELI